MTQIPSNLPPSQGQQTNKPQNQQYSPEFWNQFVANMVYHSLIPAIKQDQEMSKQASQEMKKAIEGQ